MSKFRSVDEAQNLIVNLTSQVEQILDRDLSTISKDSRSIDLWMEEFGRNEDYKATKELLMTMEMTLVDAEIFCLHNSKLVTA